jgi:hypothetical protein
MNTEVEGTPKRTVTTFYLEFEVVDNGPDGAKVPDAARMIELLRVVVPEDWWAERDEHWTLRDIREVVE